MTFGEHSGDEIYLKMSAEHYRMHVVFCKNTRAKQPADTGFFKHKYITQPTVSGHHCQCIYKSAGCHSRDSTFQR
jgi:hypothetical protein